MPLRCNPHTTIYSQIEFYECELLMVHACTILASICINHFYSCFVKTDFTLSSFYWIFLSLLLELPHLFYLRELGSTPWVCTIPLQNLESIRFITLKPFDNLGVCHESFRMRQNAKICSLFHRHLLVNSFAHLNNARG